MTSMATSASRAFGVTLVLSLLCASPVVAQTSPQDRALAQSLFDEGRRLMKEGKPVEACPKFAESQRLDPAGGTLLNLSICYEKAGKTASAWAAYQEALVVAERDGHEGRVKYMRSKIDELRPQVSFAVVVVAEGSRVQGLEVRVGEQVLSAAAWGTPIALDAGDHVVVASAPGRDRWERRVTVADGGHRVRVEVPLLAGSPAEPPPAVTEAASPVEQQPPPATSPSASSSAAIDTGPRGAPAGAPWMGYAVAGAGLVSLGVGSFFGVRALSTWEDRKSHCDGNTCDETGLDLDEETKRYATYANVGIGLGIVGVGVGTYLLLRGGEEVETKVAVEAGLTPGGGGLVLGGAF